jgi:ABC-type proline/glycine betaine transport system permease subunit
LTTIPLLTIVGTLAGFFAIFRGIPRPTAMACAVVSVAALVSAGVVSDRVWQRIAYFAWALVIVGLVVWTRFGNEPDPE